MSHLSQARRCYAAYVPIPKTVIFIGEVGVDV